ncbi:MAG: hypothetical protein ACXIUW_03410 [Roseinatronobacter sp.]
MQSCFLVLVNFSFVAKDVSATLEQLGHGTPLVPRAEAEALDLLKTLDPGAALRLAVIQCDPIGFATSALRLALEQRGTQIILLHDFAYPTVASIPYPILTLPFFTEDLEQIIAGLERG